MLKKLKSLLSRLFKPKSKTLSSTEHRPPCFFIFGKPKSTPKSLR